MVAGMQTCGLCGGSGRDIVTPGSRTCSQCGGLGQVPEPIRIDVGRGRRARAGSDNSGCGLALIWLVLLGAAVIVGAGYVLAAEMVWNYWAGGRFSEHRWDRVAIYAAASIGAVVIAARCFGFLVGALVGLIPALPLYHATQGEVGFWFIVFHEPNKSNPIGNTATSWIALVGMIAIHWGLAWLVQRRNERLARRLLRWHWIASPTGIAATVLLAAACALATFGITRAVDAF